MTFPVAFNGHVLPRDQVHLEDGAGIAVSPAGQGILRYNDSTSSFQVSISGAAYVDIATGAGAGPWDRTGTVTHLDFSTDQVGVGTAAPAATVKMQIDATVDPSGSGNGTLVVNGSGQNNETTVISAVRSRSGGLAPGELITNFYAEVPGDAADAAGSLIHAYTAGVYFDNGGSASASAFSLIGDPSTGDLWPTALTALNNDLAIVANTLFAGDGNDVQVISASGFGGGPSDGGDINFVLGSSVGGGTGGRFLVTLPDPTSTGLRIEANGAQSANLLEVGQTSGLLGLSVQPSPFQLTLNPSAVGAGSNSTVLNLQGETSAGTRSINAVNECDAGTDTYRLRIDDNGANLMVDVAFLAGTGSIWRFEDTGLNIRNESDVPILTAVAAGALTITNVTEVTIPDVLTWSADTTPVAADEVGIDTATGRLRMFVAGASIEAATIDDVGAIGYNAGTTPVAFSDVVYVLGSNLATTEGEAQWVAARSGTLKNLYVQATANTLDAGTPVTLRINGAPTTVTVTVPLGDVALHSDVANTAAVAAGDLISLEIDASGSTGGSIRGCRLGFQFAAANA